MNQNKGSTTYTSQRNVLRYCKYRLQHLQRWCDWTIVEQLQEQLGGALSLHYSTKSHKITSVLRVISGEKTYSLRRTHVVPFMFTSQFLHNYSTCCNLWWLHLQHNTCLAVAFRALWTSSLMCHFMCVCVYVLAYVEWAYSTWSVVAALILVELSLL